MKEKMIKTLCFLVIFMICSTATADNKINDGKNIVAGEDGTAGAKPIPIEVTLRDVQGKYYPGVWAWLMRPNDFTAIDTAHTDSTGTANFVSRDKSNTYFIFAQLERKDLSDDSLAEFAADRIYFISKTFQIDRTRTNKFDVVFDNSKAVNMVRISTVNYANMIIRNTEPPYYYVKAKIGDIPDGYISLILPLYHHYSIYGSMTDKFIQDSFICFDIYATPGLSIIL